ncbi:potassium uptake TrkH family protein [Stackebrandtia albiflava]|uniref:Potassium uptake TrkH family protein n=1 Tax=Stackebrandtia albiflava TaxID=406432 RepID=A0A562V437_9ACTN|nr:potassium transporter TrkG [Stackebrandtia albiflava]TWJ12640.1 potassium uptake TrkH family protein [Stackebrandtia albiflava]
MPLPAAAPVGAARRFRPPRRAGFRRPPAHPVRRIPLAFLAAIVVGAGLLATPAARTDPGDFDVMPALFTAVSAVCVTGLATVDTATYWTGFGQVVILALIQAGGFGIMTLATMAASAVGARLGLRSRLVAQTESRSTGIGEVAVVVRRVLVVSVTVEAVVAVVLACRFAFGYGYDWPTAWWHGVFHSVSAFNNAGFALYGDSLTRFATDPWVTLPIGAAVILGGLGFPVVAALWAWRRRSPGLHARMSLWGTAVLLLVGFVTYLGFEWDNPATLGGLAWWDKAQLAWFSGLVPRTAGFNALPVGELTSETLLVTDVLMLVGGAPAGTAGGLKVTTVMLLGAVIWSELRGRPDVSVFRRSIGAATQRQALTVVLSGVAVVGVTTLALSVSTPYDFEAVSFEAVSAFATVGLSTGITPELSAVAQVVLMVAMFLGRVGTVVVATALVLRARRTRYRFPEESLSVG